MRRTIWNISIFIVALVFPWWISGILTLIGMWYFRNYFEAIGIGALLDILYSGSYSLVYNIPLLFTIGAGLLLLMPIFFRDSFRFTTHL